MVLLVYSLKLISISSVFMEVIFSGIQPSGHLTIGNYLGALKNWVGMQDTNNCIYCIVDLHALTMPQDPKELKESCITSLALYLASGLSPEKSTIFIQSSISAHAELGWIFACLTPLGWLKRMTQFKDKAGKNIENVGLGLLAYPTLMAADILLYHATKVPVGEDQTQHLELARDIAGAFNRKFNVEYFKEPQLVNRKESARIMSLRDGRKKMSKSDPSDMSRINMIDSPDLIFQKIKKATTDTINGIYYDVENRPEVSNLLSIYAAFSGESIETISNRFKNAQTSDFKRELTEVIVSALSPIQTEYKKLMADRSYLSELASIGSNRASEIANKTLSEVKEIVGLFTGF
jgi:tryptophanyl-tRNA synthetase